MAHGFDGLRDRLAQMATDKLIMGFLFLVVVGVITIIALKMFGVVGGDKVNFPDQPKDLV